MNRMIPDYYLKDKKIGDTVLINGENAYYKYNADLINDEEVPGMISNDYNLREGSFSFYGNDQEITPSVHTWYFYIGGETKEDAMRNVSALLAVCRECTIHREDEPYHFEAVIQSYTLQETGVQFYYTLGITCETIKRGETITIPVNEETSDYVGQSSPGGQERRLVFNNPGTLPSLISIQYRSPSWGSSETAHNIELSDTIRLYVQSQLGFYMDAEKGRITDDYGAHNATETLKKYNDFLIAEPGENTIEINGIMPEDLANDRLQISFAPVYA